VPTPNWKQLCEGRGSGGGALVKVEQSAESFRFADGAVFRTARTVREGDNIGEALVIALVLMMRQIFFKGMMQGALTEQNQLIETLVLD